MKVKMVIAERRKEFGVSQSYVSNLTGITERQLSRYENNHEIPKLTTLIKISDALGVKIESLYEVER